MKLYHYTTLDSFAKIWVSKQLKFSPPQNTNDLFEREKLLHILRSLMYDLRPCDFQIPIHDYWDYFHEVLFGFKQISLVCDYEDSPGYKSPLMWGQYAHNEQGVCIEFDSDKIPNLESVYSSKVYYVTIVPFIDIPKPIACGKEDIRNLILKNKDAFFFTKHKHWEHENEYRIVSDKDDFLKIEDAITCVYIANNHHVNTQVVERLVNDEVHVKYIQTYVFSNSKGFPDIDRTAFRHFNKKINEEPFKSQMHKK